VANKNKIVIDLSKDKLSKKKKQSDSESKKSIFDSRISSMGVSEKKFPAVYGGNYNLDNLKGINAYIEKNKYRGYTFKAENPAHGVSIKEDELAEFQLKAEARSKKEWDAVKKAVWGFFNNFKSVGFDLGKTFLETCGNIKDSIGNLGEVAEKSAWGLSVVKVGSDLANGDYRAADEDAYSFLGGVIGSILGVPEGPYGIELLSLAGSGLGKKLGDGIYDWAFSDETQSIINELILGKTQPAQSNQTSPKLPSLRLPSSKEYSAELRYDKAHNQIKRWVEYNKKIVQNITDYERKTFGDKSSKHATGGHSNPGELPFTKEFSRELRYDKAHNLKKRWVEYSKKHAQEINEYIRKTFGNKISKHASGGLFNHPHLGLVAEDGPEAIIPLSTKRRSSGLSLWKEAGRLMGAEQYAGGGIVGNVTPLHSKSSASSRSDDGPVQVSLAGNSFHFHISGGDNAKDIVKQIESHADEIVNIISLKLAPKLEKAFVNRTA
jgi:hypothetical protein